MQCLTIGDGKIKENWIKLYFPAIYNLVQGVKPAWITWCEDSRMGFDNLYVTSQHVYLLLNRKFAKERPFANEVLMLSWEGEIKKRFILSQTVQTIAVDESRKIIYATTCGFNTEAHIVAFPFK